jgi:hypothetical protein
VNGRKAILLVSSGVDTFSKTTYQDVLKTARASDSPVYAIRLAPSLREYVMINEPAGPLPYIDWSKGEMVMVDSVAAAKKMAK